MLKQSSKILSKLLLMFSCLLALPGYVEAQACTPAEVKRIITFSKRMVDLVVSGSNLDTQQLSNATTALNNSLSLSCQTALAQAQRANPYGGSGNPGRPPQVLDHGGGQYSVPGVGACDPGGCVAY